MAGWIGWGIGVVMAGGLAWLIAVVELRRQLGELESQHEDDLEAARKGAAREAMREHEDCLLRLHLTVMSNVQTMPARRVRQASPLN